MNNKYNSIAKYSTSRARLSEVGSLLAVAIWRLYSQEREKTHKNSLDFRLKQSVTPAATSYERLK